MPMMLLPVCLLCCCLLFETSFAADRLLWPLAGERVLTGGHADSRPDHFHGGIDLRARTPLPVLAPSDGWVERLSVVPGGYGRVLYLRLADGRTAVFGHLSRFAPVLEEMLRDSQLAVGTFRVDCEFPAPAPRRSFKRGDILAYTGKSGAGPAHLHFELREGSVQTDPLAAFAQRDDEPPVIVSLAWTTLSGFTPQSSGRPLHWTPVASMASQPLRADPVRAGEPVAFFIQTYDPGPWGRNAVPAVLRVKIGDSTIFEERPARIDVAGPRSIYHKLVWAVRKLRRADIRRLFNVPPPAQYLDFERDGRGWISDLKDGEVFVEIEDRAGNTTVACLNVSAGSWPGNKPTVPPAELTAGRFALSAKSDPTASWARLEPLSSHELRIGPDGFAFGDRLRLAWCCVGQGGPGKPFFYELHANGKRKPLWMVPAGAPDSLACLILRGGTYGVAYDPDPPELRLTVGKGRQLRFNLKDLLSAIDDSAVRCTVDGRTAIAEYDVDEGGGAVWTREPLTRGSHEVVFSAADRAGNRKTWTIPIHVP